MSVNLNKIIFEGSFGPAHFRQNEELAFYGTSYHRSESNLGLEWGQYFQTQWMQGTLLSDVSFDYTGGDVVNLGSHRYASFLRFGPRLHFGAMDKNEFMLTGRVGVGVAQNELNFGKGIIPPTDENSVNVQMQVSAEFVHCFNPVICMGPKLGVSMDASILGDPGYTSRHWMLGFSLSGVISPLPQLDERAKEVVRLEGKFAEQGTKIQELVQEREGLEETARLSENFLDRSAAIPQYYSVLFQNGRADIELQEQSFPGGPVDKWGKSHPFLDTVIRQMRLIMDNIKAVTNEGSLPAYTIEMTVRGFANDADDNDLENRNLADARSKEVVKYLTTSKSTLDEYGNKVDPLGTNIPESGGVPVLSIKSVPSSEIPSEDIVDYRLKSEKNVDKLSLSQLMQLASDIKNPVWRIVIIEYQIRKLESNGHYREVPIKDL